MDLNKKQSDLNFENQLSTFEGSHGLIFYISKHIPKYKSREEVEAELLETYIHINEYDPMMLHGVKSLNELQHIAEKSSYQTFINDQDSPYDVKRIAINKNDIDGYLKTKLDIEGELNFISWIGANYD